MSTDQSAKQRSTSSVLIQLAAFVIVVLGMRAAQSILAPIFLAAFLAIICFPPLAWLRQKRVPTWLALTLVAGGGIILMLLVVSLVGPSLSNFSAKLPGYQDALTQKRDAILLWLTEHGVDVSELAEQRAFDPQRLMRLANTMVSALGSLFSEAALVLLLFLFMLVEATILPQRLTTSLGFSAEQDSQLGRIVDKVRRYNSMKAKLSLLTGVLVAVSLWILGVDFPLLWGLLAFFLNFVPTIGSILAAIPAVLLAFVQHGFGSAAFCALAYLAINVTVGNVLEPRLMGRGFGLSTLAVVLSLVFWGWVLGPVGMLLSVPLTIIVVIALESTNETRWIAGLLGSPTRDEAEA